jgi:phosphoglycolate phosphatase-like HAD superfamily hydrolase
VRLLLFDIDGTLIKGDQAGRLAMGAALEYVFGTRGSLDTYSMGGKTDLGIVSDVLIEAGLNQEEIDSKIAYFYKVMAEFAHEIYPTRAIDACPGVQSLLVQLRDRDGVLLGLLTGNAQTTAPLKLAAAGIDPDQFVVAAFGSDNVDRNNLPAIALHRANAMMEEIITGENVAIIGDTPADVACARAGGATAIAVASGWHTADTLLQYQPDYLFADLSDTAAVLKVLLGN